MVGRRNFRSGEMEGFRVSDDGRERKKGDNE